MYVACKICFLLVILSPSLRRNSSQAGRLISSPSVCCCRRKKCEKANSSFYSHQTTSRNDICCKKKESACTSGFFNKLVADFKIEESELAAEVVPAAEVATPRTLCEIPKCPHVWSMEYADHESLEYEYYRSEEKRVCKCRNGINGVSLAYDWWRSQWPNPQDTRMCLPKQDCPAFSYAVEGGCRCSIGYRGKVTINLESQTWASTCAKQECPGAAIGHPNCICGESGYKRSATLEWDSENQEYRGHCTKIHCPWPAVDHPRCTCPEGYQMLTQYSKRPADNLLPSTWNDNYQWYEDSCIPSWAGLPRKIEYKHRSRHALYQSCWDIQTYPVDTLASCQLAAVELEVSKNGVQVVDYDIKKGYPAGCYILGGYTVMFGKTSRLDERNYSWKKKYGLSHDHKTMQPICQRDNKDKECKWQFWDPSHGPKFSDVAQGDIATCYFLASLASLAHFHPQLIKDMFVSLEESPALQSSASRQETTCKPEFRTTCAYAKYRTQWAINGRLITVAIDDKVPTNPNGRPHFVKYNQGYDFWPLILEKAWAKIYGSFKRIELGNAWEALSAVTQGPVRTYKFSNMEEVNTWERLEIIMRESLPAVASSSSKASGRLSAASKPRHGITADHSYALLDAREVVGNRRACKSEGEGCKIKVVQLYNPWSHNKYDGVLAWEDDGVTKKHIHDGSFFMTLSEFHEAFDELNWAYVQPGYHSSWQTVKFHGSTVKIKFYFYMSDDSQFWYMVTWPTSRFVELGASTDCAFFTPKVKVNMQHWNTENVPTNFWISRFSNKTDGHSWVRVPGGYGAGTYGVELEVNFKGVTWIPEISLVVYARQEVKFNVPEGQKGIVYARQEVKFNVAKGQKGNTTRNDTCAKLVHRTKELDNYLQIARDKFDKKFPPIGASIGKGRCGDPMVDRGLVNCSEFGKCWASFDQVACPDEGNPPACSGARRNFS